MPFDLAEKFIVSAEEKLGARLPESYRAKMLGKNGGEVLIEDKTTCDQVWWLHPILDTSDRKRLKRSCNDIVHETRMRESYEHPDWPVGAVEIGNNGSGDALLFCEKRHNWVRPFLPGVTKPVLWNGLQRIFQS